MVDQARSFIERYEELESEMGREEVAADPALFAKLNKEYRDLSDGVERARLYIQKVAELEEAQRMLREEKDGDLVAMAREEIAEIEDQLPLIEQELQLLLVPRDPYDLGNAILEIRAGTGGDESCLFAGDLLRMYRAYCESQGWSFRISSVSEGPSGGFKEVKIDVEGAGVYGMLKFESGVHRVQRVPETESQGRVHTSAATVAVFPEADDIEIELRDEDLRIDTYRASGAGGQHINKTDSAVRLTHLPTGIVVSSQDERSQIKNRDKAFKEMRSRLLDKAISEKQASEAASRKAQVGTGDRSGKIRTYNFPQARVTDHRINLTLYKLDAVINGDLQELLDALRMADAQEKLGQNAEALR